MEEDNTQREEPKQDGIGDVPIGKNSRCALCSQRFSVNIYQHLLSVSLSYLLGTIWHFLA